MRDEPSTGVPIERMPRRTVMDYFGLMARLARRRSHMGGWMAARMSHCVARNFSTFSCAQSAKVRAGRPVTVSTVGSTTPATPGGLVAS